MSTAPASRPEIRVLVVDDSPFMRHAIERLLAATPTVRVVGGAGDGMDALQKVIELRPDVITMDVNMPRMDGVRAIDEIMRTLPTPIVMLSTLTAEGSDTAIRAMEAGAVECVGKPSGRAGELATVAAQLSMAVVRASHARVRHRPGTLAVSPPAAAVRTPNRPQGIASRGIVVIGASTGGPPALTAIIPQLPATLAAGVVVVQHMPAGFTAALARRLDALSPLAVKEAEAGDLVATGTILIAPGDFHLTIGDDRRVRLSQTPTLHGVRPAIDITLESVAAAYGRHAVAAILTGMGSDGAKGAAGVERAGGQVIVQDEVTSVVYGMPKVALRETRAAMERPVTEIAGEIVRAVGLR